MTCTKRTTEMDQSVDTFAVCTSCSRLSCNLRTCDKCGSSLSDDNAAQCYSSDPKRVRAESPNKSNLASLSNGLPVSADLVQSVTTNISSAILDNSVRPQALYVNVNNQAIPFFGESIPSACGAMTLSSTSLVSSQNTSTVTSSSVGHNGTVGASQGVAICNRQVSTTGRQVICSGASNSAASNQHQISLPSCQINLPSYNLQPPPPPFAASVTRLPGIVSGSMQAAVVTSPAAVPNRSSIQSVQVNAVQIRIGTKKFKPSSAVTFKDDGILFTLKDYTYAPVLLNARAIMKCKANLSTFSYPVLFLFLENSCMRQIRNIFGLTSNDFSHNSQVEMKRCISIFPVFGAEGKSQAQSIMYTIKRSFEAMVRRYPRSSGILEDISNDQTIDILLELEGSDSVARTDLATSELAPADSPVSQSPMLPVTSVSTISRLDLSSNVSSTALSVIQNLGKSVASNGLHSAACSPIVTTMAVTPQTVASQIAQLSRIQSAAPVLQIPNDQSRWHLMQKGLVANGVYHVLMPNGHRQYCLWNGKQLVPCFVQNTEVQLSCMRVRIGTLLALSVGQIRVKADQSSGIHFTVKSDHCGTQEIAITPDDVSTCEACFSNIAVMFLLLNNVGADKIRKKMKLHLNSDPAFDPSGPVRMKYILLFLNNVNRDQEEALMQMKFHRAGENKPMIETIDIARGINLLVQMKLDTTSDKAVTEFLSSGHENGLLGLEKLVNDIASTVVGSSTTVDDDDDVIMTQEEVGVKCPYTQQVMKNPVRNTICGHNYERNAIQEFILRKKGIAKCPFAGCANLVPLRMEDLIDNEQLRNYISSYGSA